MNIDHTDRRILAILQRHGRMTYQELGEAVGLSAPGAYQRVKRLEDSGVIMGYGARVDQVALGRSVLVVLEITPSEPRMSLGQSASAGEVAGFELVDGTVISVRRFEDVTSVTPQVDELRAAGYRVRVRLGRPDRGGFG